MPRHRGAPAEGGCFQSRERQFKTGAPKRLSLRLFLLWSAPALLVFSLLPALYVLLCKVANETAGGGGPPTKGSENGGGLVAEGGRGDFALKPQTAKGGYCLERHLGFMPFCCPDHWSTASCPVVPACKDSARTRSLSLNLPRTQHKAAFHGPQQQLSPAVGDCSMLLVREEGPREGPPPEGALAGFWHRVSRPQGGEGGVWGAPLFASDGGLLLRREFEGVWKVFSAAFGGAVVAYVATKQPFPTGSKWWVQQQQQQQQQQWKLEKRLRAECTGGGPSRGGGPSSSLRNIFVGSPAAAVTACHASSPQEEGALSLTTGPPSFKGPYRGLQKPPHGGPQGAPYSFPKLLCGHLTLQPQRAEALQQSLLAATEKLFERRRGEVQQQEQQQQRQEEQQQQQQEEQQQQFWCRRLVVSGGVGLGGLGCTGSFLLLKPSEGVSFYFSLSLDARISYLFIQKGIAVCGTEGPLPVAAGLYAHSSSSNSSSSGSSSRSSSSSELLALLAEEKEAEVKGLWLQEGGTYAAAPMRLRCTDTVAPATSAARSCSALRLRGFASAALNGIWRLSGRVNDKPSFLKYSNWIDLAVAAAALEARPAAAAAGAAAKSPAGAAAAAAAGRAVLHLYYEEALGLWVIAPSLPVAAAAGAADAAASPAAANAAAAAVQRDKKAGRPTEVAAEAAGRGLLLGAAAGFRGIQKIVAFSRSAAGEPPAGLWSVFGEREGSNMGEREAAESQLVQVNLVQIHCLSSTGP
ncbi:hypothetical protein Esti_004335 [Eimeria stiedai]